MAAEDNGLTLQSLANRLEVLERENSQLRRELSVLKGSATRRDEITGLRSSETRQDGNPVVDSSELVSRRSLLNKAGAAAVATLAAGTLLSAREAKAHPLDASISPDTITTHFIFADNHIDSGPTIQATATVASPFEGSGAVEGVNNGSGPGLKGINNTTGGTGVEGRGSIGGLFSGDKAQLRLVPNFSAGPPTTGQHTKGEIYMDSAGTLFVCRRSGKPGSWRRFETVAV